MTFNNKVGLSNVSIRSVENRTFLGNISDASKFTGFIETHDWDGFVALEKDLLPILYSQFSYVPGNKAKNADLVKTRLSSRFEGFTFLHVATMNCAAAIVSWILVRAPDLANIPNQSGDLPLHIACLVDNFVSVKELVDKTADVNVANQAGQTPLHFAAEASIQTLICFCRAENVFYDATNNQGKTAHQISAEAFNTGNAKYIEANTKSENDENDIYWFPNSIDRYECINPIASYTNKTVTFCKCGYPMTSHQPLLTKYGFQIFFKDDVVSLPTDAFGELEFSTLNQVTKYVRLTDTTNLDVINGIIMRWKVDKPTLIISIHGNELEKPIVKSALKKGIWKAASSEGSWIVTNGEARGVNQVVGQAVKEYCDVYGKDIIRVIGIVPWRRIQNNEELINQQFGGMFPAHMNHDKNRNENTCRLDTNHTHLLMVDTGTSSEKGCEIAFRTQLMQHLINWKDETRSTGVSPHCGILIGGDRKVLREVYFAMTENTMTFVVLKGSGGLADIIGEVIDHMIHNESIQQKNPSAPLLEVDDDKMLSLMQDAWQIPIMVDISEDLTYLKDILIINRQCIEIFSIDEDKSTELEAKILGSLLNSASGMEEDDPTKLNIGQLKMAIALNRSDIAKEKIFTDEKTWKKGDLDELMIEVLTESKESFVKLFMEHGFSLEEFTTIPMLEQLYTQDINEARSQSLILKHVLQKVDLLTTSKVTLGAIGKVLQYFMGNSYKPLYRREEFVLNVYNPFKRGERASKFDRPAREIFIWCLFTKRIELAEYFWSLDKEPIPNSLFAAKIIRQMAKITEDINESEELEEFAGEFEKKAEGVLNVCYDENPYKARETLVRVLYYYGDLTCFVLAAEGGSIMFIAHRCCQELLELIWRDNLDEKNTSFIFLTAMVLGICCPPIVPFVLQYKPGVHEKYIATKLVKRKQKMESKQTNSTLASVVDFKEFDIEKEMQKQSSWFESGRLKVSVHKKKLMDFYMAPVVRFAYSTAIYVTFMLVFANVLLFNVFKGAMNDENYVASLIVETIVCIWVFSLLIEELRQVSFKGNSFSDYIDDTMNKLDMLALFSYFLGFMFSILSSADIVTDWLFFEVAEITPLWANVDLLLRLARIFFGLSFVTLFVRLIQVFSLHVRLGPMIVMIQHMITNDLIPFMVMFLSFVICYGIFMWSMVYPGNTGDGTCSGNSCTDPIKIIMKLLRIAYFQAFGDFQLELMLGQDCTTNCPDAWGVWLGPILLGVHMVLTNVLLLNLLIAMFSNTYEKIQSSSKQYWTLQRYLLMREFTERSPVPAPLNIFYFFYEYFRDMCQCGSHSMEYEGTYTFRKIFKNDSKLIQWEHMRTQDYIRQCDEQNFNSRNSGSGGADLASFMGRNAPGALGQSTQINMKKDFVHLKEEIGEQFQEKLRFLEQKVTRLEPMEERLNELINVFNQFSLTLSEQQMRILDFVKKTQGTPHITSSVAEPVVEIECKQEYSMPVHTSKLRSPRPPSSRPRSAGLKPLERPIWSRRFQNHTLLRLNSTNMDTNRAVVLHRNWNQESDNYDPHYVDKSIYSSCSWADPPDWQELNFNVWDRRHGVNRVSLTGHTYTLVPSVSPGFFSQLDDLASTASDQMIQPNSTEAISCDDIKELNVKKIAEPLNPSGRTGIKGRGVFPMWGPNHAMHLLLTRWKRDDKDNIVKREGKPLLQMVANTADKRVIQLPCFMTIHHDECDMSSCCITAFIHFLKNRVEELSQNKLPIQVQFYRDIIDLAQSLKPTLIYSGYFEDDLNTDNAWLETVAINFQESYNNRFNRAFLEIMCVDKWDKFEWVDMVERRSTHPGHTAFQRIVATNHEASF